MDKSEGRVQILDGHLFFSPNCSRTIDYPPPLEDENGCIYNIFLPDNPPTGRQNYFELDIAEYAVPRWWSLAFGWIAFLPLHPSFTGPIFEKLIMPGNHLRDFDEETQRYSMSPGLRNKWLQVDQDLLDAIQIICSHYGNTLRCPGHTTRIRAESRRNGRNGRNLVGISCQWKPTQI